MNLNLHEIENLVKLHFSDWWEYGNTDIEVEKAEEEMRNKLGYTLSDYALYCEQTRDGSFETLWKGEKNEETNMSTSVILMDFSAHGPKLKQVEENQTMVYVKGDPKEAAGASTVVANLSGQDEKFVSMFKVREDMIPGIDTEE